MKGWKNKETIKKRAAPEHNEQDVLNLTGCKTIL